MSNRIEKLANRILKLCDTEEFGCAIGALQHAADAVFEKIPDEQVRAEFLIALMHMLVFVAPAHNTPNAEEMRRVVRCMTNVRDRQARAAAILGYINELTGLMGGDGDVDMEHELKKIAIIQMPYCYR